MANKFSVEAVFKGVDKFSAPVKRMENKVGKFTRSMERGFRRVNRAVTKLADKMKAGFRRGAIVLAAVVTGVAIAIKKVADRADELAKSARILDLPIEQLQEWQFVAEQSGVSADSLTKSLGILDKQVGQARTGTGTLVTMLKKSNPQLLKQITHAKDTGVAFDIMIKALRKVKNPTDRAALSFAAFGRQGLALINIANTSVKGLKKLREEARKNGLITEKQARAAEAFNDQLNSLTHTIQGIVQEALLPLMPILKNYLALIQKWIFANKVLIKMRIKEFVEGVGKAIRFLVRHGKTIAIVTGVFFGLMAVLRIFIVVMTAVNFVLTANPIGIIIVAIGLLIAAIALLILHFKKVRDFFVTFGDIAVKAFKLVKDELLKLFSPLIKIGSFISKLFSGIPKIPKGITITHQAGPLTARTSPQIVSPQERTARAVNETRTTSTSEVTIKDETGKAQVTRGKLGAGLKLQPSGAF